MVVINLLSYTNKKDKNVSSKFADEYKENTVLLWILITEEVVTSIATA